MPEVRLIDANAVLSSIAGCRNIVEPTEEDRMKAYARLLIRNAPTIEAEPVRHGRWILKILPIGGGDKIRSNLCSECDRYANMKFDYCPNCGAKMDGGADNG